MAAIKIFKTTALPAILNGHSVYLVAPVTKPNYVEIYVTSADASVVKRVINSDDIQSMINSSIAANGSVDIVDNITMRNALVPVNGKFVLVLDATGDTTVVSGSATYVWRASSLSWIKVTEHESLDVVVTWNSVQNKPTSLVANIDAAVTQRHVHANLTQLTKITESGTGDFLYSGLEPRVRLELAEW